MQRGGAALDDLATWQGLDDIPMEAPMRSRVVTCLGATGLIATLAGVGQPAVQAQQQARYPYVLVDLGTVGGPQSNVLFFAQTLNNQGMVGGAADTASLDPYASNPYPFLQ